MLYVIAVTVVLVFLTFAFVLLLLMASLGNQIKETRSLKSKLTSLQAEAQRRRCEMANVVKLIAKQAEASNNIIESYEILANSILRLEVEVAEMVSVDKESFGKDELIQ